MRSRIEPDIGGVPKNLSLRPLLPKVGPYPSVVGVCGVPDLKFQAHLLLTRLANSCTIDSSASSEASW